MELSPPLIGRWSSGSWSDATEPARMDVNGNKAGKMCLPGLVAVYSGSQGLGNMTPGGLK